MIDLFAVISLGGLVHWTFVSHKFDHLTLINVIFDNLKYSESHEKSSEFIVGNNSVKCFLNEELELIYVLAHPKMFPIDWTESFMKRIDNLIVKEYAEILKSENGRFTQFDNETFIVKFKEAIKKEEFKSKDAKKTTATAAQTGKKTQSSNNGRSWNDKVNKSDLVSLDYSDKSSETSSRTPLILDEKSKVDESSDFESDDEEEQLQTVTNTWWNSLKSLTGNNPLKSEDLEPALKQMKIHLISKNVASEPAEFVVKSVGNRLEGRVPGTFSSISRMVREATKETLQKILTPNKPTDLLNEIKNRTDGRPFVITFIGVNGVGKSTNLAKVAYWLLQHEFRVLLVAGDTFRAGAIEQLRHHCKNLSVMAPGRIEIYERGYGKDAALIAQDAIKYAKEKGFDLVLVDTAGRMQDNGPLMIALAKLVNLNRPDRVIFVGEALVGHDALSQLQKFNSALLDHSAKPIDGILLTKVDTIDDKIGAALSMTLTAKAPILFMGVGQTYTDLKRINIKQVVDLLLK